MSVNTIGMIGQKYKAENIVEFLKTIATIKEVTSNDFEDFISTFVEFNYHGEERRMQIIKVKEEGSQDPNDADNSLTTFKLDYSGKSIEIIKTIASNFQGWIIENDENQDSEKYLVKLG